MSRLIPPAFAAALLTSAFAPTSSLAAQDDTLWVRRNFTKHEYRIPMRDGVRLFTAVYVPKDTVTRHPILLRRTPYSVRPYGADAYIQPAGIVLQMLQEGYILALQDVRGRYMSEGQFVDVRPQCAARGVSERGSRTEETGRAPSCVDESTDTWDTIDWLVKNVPANNGRVGMQGVSYPGFYAALGGVNHHPALRVTSPQAPVADWFIGDDFHHNGALYLAHTFHFFSGFGKPRPRPTTEPTPGIDIGTPDGYGFFLELGPLSNVNARYFKDSVAFWNDVVRHPNYDEFWQARNVLPRLTNMPPAVLNVGGWFDAEDLYGPLKVYESVEQKNPGVANHLVMGPWDHGRWSSGDASFLGAVTFGTTGPFFRDSLFIPFFNHYLKDGPDPRLAEAIVFETGTNAWRRYDAWPPSGLRRQSLYLRENARLSMEAPSVTPAPRPARRVPSGRARAAARPEPRFDEFTSDPAHPVPYIGYIAPGMTREHMVDDQRFAATRPDVLVYETESLTKPLTIAGPITVTLHVSTTGTDADWIVKLIDVYPDTLRATLDPQLLPPQRIPLGGYQQLVRGEAFRGRFRNSFSRPEPFVPGRPTTVEYVMPDVNHTFLPGHKIMVQVQSSWFPLVDRNPQTFVDNIYRAREGDFRKATHRVYRSADLPSRITVGVVEEGRRETGGGRREE